MKEKKRRWQQWHTDGKEESRRKYQESKRNCKRVILEEKRKSWEKFTKVIEEDVYGSKRIVYGLIKSKRKERVNTKLVKDERGELLTQPEGIRNRWKEYFDKLLNVRKDPTESEKEKEHGTERDNDITMLEVENALKKMKTGKSVGVDEVPVEMIKAEGAVGL